MIRAYLYTGILAAVLALLAGTHINAKRIGRAEIQAKWDADKLVRSTKALETIKEYRSEEARRQEESTAAVAEARLRADVARRDAAAARAAAVGLHAAAAGAAAACDRPAADPAAPAGSAPAAGPGLLLSDVLVRADDTAGELAAAFDDAHTAGLACERAYDSLNKAKP